MKTKNVFLTACVSTMLILSNQTSNELGALKGASNTESIRIAKPSTFCFSAYKVVKTKKYGKLKCSPYPRPGGIVWIWTRI